MWRGPVAAYCLAFALASQVFADEAADRAWQVSQGAIGSTVSDFTFRDTDGNDVKLAQFRGKPLLVALIYTGCADVCPAVIENLAPAVAAAEDTLGRGSFNVITVGFDNTRDTPERMKAFAQAHKAGGPNWYFLASDEAAMERFSAAVGFDFASSAGGFDHVAQITVLDGAGTIYDQVYGSSFSPPAIVDPLRNIVLGRARTVFSLEGLADRVKLFCTVYDPRTGRYNFDYSLFVSIFIGAGSLIAVLAFLIREARKSLRASGA